MNIRGTDLYNKKAYTVPVISTINILVKEHYTEHIFLHMALLYTYII